MSRFGEFFFDTGLPPEFMSQTSAQQFIRDPNLFTESTPSPAKKEPDNKNKTEPVVLRASICCSSCEDIIKHDLFKVKGVKTVECDVYRQKVTVTGTAGLADILSAARKSFKDAKQWD